MRVMSSNSTHEVDASMYGDEPARPYPRRDLVPSHTLGQQLPAGDDTVLPPSEPRDRAIG